MPVFNPGAFSAFQLVTTFNIAAPVANVDFANLDYDELIFVGTGLTMSASGFRALQVSTNNGSTFYSTSGDYSSVSVAGGVVADTLFGYHDTASALARGLVCRLSGLKARSYPAVCDSNGSSKIIFTANLTDKINALRLVGVGGNLTAGSGYLLGK